jgi:hypothetical protein
MTDPAGKSQSTAPKPIEPACPVKSNTTYFHANKIPATTESSSPVHPSFQSERGIQTPV